MRRGAILDALDEIAFNKDGDGEFIYPSEERSSALLILLICEHRNLSGVDLSSYIDRLETENTDLKKVLAEYKEQIQLH